MTTFFRCFIGWLCKLSIGHHSLRRRISGSIARRCLRKVMVKIRVSLRLLCSRVTQNQNVSYSWYSNFVCILHPLKIVASVDDTDFNTELVKSEGEGENVSKVWETKRKSGYISVKNMRKTFYFGMWLCREVAIGTPSV